MAKRRRVISYRRIRTKAASKAECPCCGEVFWLDEARTIVEVERVYATRIDCMP